MAAIGLKMTSYQLLIDVPQLQELLGAANCRVVDCRFDLLNPEKGRAQYLEGHIPGAVFADLDRDLAGPVTGSSGRHPLPASEDFAATVGRWGIDPETEVVVYDYANGGLAARLWWMLRWIGHSRVALLDGGIGAWLAAGGMLEESVPEYPSSAIAAVANDELVVTTEEILAKVSSGAPLGLVDARDRPRFDGVTEPIDPVAGHVPGAVNLPFSETVGRDGRFRPTGELRDAWRQIAAGESGEGTTVMCGSGVTACHLVLSALVAGLDEPRVYIGSWSEWIRDPDRPVAPAQQRGS